MPTLPAKKFLSANLPSLKNRSCPAVLLDLCLYQIGKHVDMAPIWVKTTRAPFSDGRSLINMLSSIVLIRRSL
jgi:hypothetical protein